VSANSNPPVSDREIPLLCYVTDRRSLSIPVAEHDVLPVSDAAKARLVERIATITAAGVDWVQIREKDLPARQLAALTRDAIARTRAAGSVPATRATREARIIVNDRVDVAVVEGAGGVHLGEAGLPVADVAQWVKRTVLSDSPRDRNAGSSQFPVEASGEFLIGASCHSLVDAKDAVRDGADYIFFGPVFATPSKAKFGEPQGVKKLAAVCSAVTVPVIAIGGITLENAGDCITAGAAGIAAIRLFQDAADPAQIVSTLKKLRR
jgi:thiamine-phosphate pyrophosphorylase